MTADLILEEALQLTPEERAQLCYEIECSLEHEDQDGSGRALEHELRRRILHARMNPEDGFSMEEWKAEILATRGLAL